MNCVCCTSGRVTVTLSSKELDSRNLPMKAGVRRSNAVPHLTGGKDASWVISCSSGIFQGSRRTGKDCRGEGKGRRKDPFPLIKHKLTFWLVVQVLGDSQCESVLPQDNQFWGFWDSHPHFFFIRKRGFLLGLFLSVQLKQLSLRLSLVYTKRCGRKTPRILTIYWSSMEFWFPSQPTC